MTIYLDYNATAPVRPEALAVMQELQREPLNASSVHGYGRNAKKHLEASRKTIAEAINCFANEIIFVGCGSEANNWVLSSFPNALVSAVEHASVLKVATPHPSLPPQGGKEYPVSSPSLLRGEDSLFPSPLTGEGGVGVNIIPVDRNGIINLDFLDSRLRGNSKSGGGNDIKLVSVMLANNETGIIQPIREIADIVHKHGALLHTDAVQALGKIPLDFSSLGVDMMTISAHKMGGPVGAAALVVRNDLPITPFIKGGGQELNRRAGTENIPAIAGFAEAVKCISLSHMEQLRKWLEEAENAILCHPLEGGREGEAFRGGYKKSVITPHDSSAADSLKRTSSAPPQGGSEYIIGKSSDRLPNTSCIAMPGVPSETQLIAFDMEKIAVSAGSACSSGRIEASHVLKAMGLADDITGSAIRVSGGWNTTETDIKSFVIAWKKLYERLALKKAC